MKNLVESIQAFQSEKYANIFWDYCSSGVWARDGRNVDADWLPVDDGIVQHIQSWHRAAEAYWNSRFEFEEEAYLLPIPEMYEGLGKWRAQIVEALRNELPDWTIR